MKQILRNLLFISILTPLLAPAVDWPQFRGPDGTGISTEKKAPLNWSRTENVKWRTPLPSPGNSSPIVSNGRVFITCTADEGRKRSLHCFDRESGKELWVRTVDFGKVMPTHRTNPYGASSAAANDKLVVVWHGSAGLFCYNFSGKEQWKKDLGEFRHMWGYAASPVIYGDKVIMNCGPGKRVYLTSIDLASGKTIWETDEPLTGNGEKNDRNQPVGSWSTPVVAKIGGNDQIVCSMNTRVNGYDPQSGKIIWSCEGLKGRKGELAYSSPHIAGDICVAVGGYGGPAIGFKLGGEGDLTRYRLWRTEPNPQSIGSGVYVGKHLYIPDAAAGTIRCLDPKTGKETWRERGSGGNYWGSMVLAAGRLYVTSQEGDTMVLAPNPEKFEKLAVNSLREKSNSTPAISDGEIFLRTFDALYCIAEK